MSIGLTRATLVKATALLVSIAALINAGIDVVKAVGNVPTGMNDRLNEQLIRRNMGKRALVDQLVQIKATNATMDMLLQVYESGDVFVRYGDHYQWLPFPLKVTGSSLFSEAHAQASSPLPRAPVKKGDPGAPSLIVIDIEQLKQTRAEQELSQKNANPPVIERDYTIARMKDDHPSPFTTSIQTYTEVLKAEPGYKIGKYEFRVANANNFKLDRIELVDDDTAVHVTFALTSGPAIDRWRGWVQGTIKTVQKRTR